MNLYSSGEVHDNMVTTSSEIKIRIHYVSEIIISALRFCVPIVLA